MCVGCVVCVCVCVCDGCVCGVWCVMGVCVCVVCDGCVCVCVCVCVFEGFFSPSEWGRQSYQPAKGLHWFLFIKQSSQHKSNLKRE